MKIIFLSMLAATALSTLSFVPNRISDSNDNINIVEVEDDYLEEPVRQVISHDPNDFWGAQSDLYSDLDGGWQVWDNIYLYVEPTDFIHNPNTNYYELNTRLRIRDVQEWNKGSLTYLGMLDYTEVYWYYDDVVYNVDQCALDVVLRTRNPNTIGGMYFFYTYYNRPTPPLNDGPSPLWHEKEGYFDYLEGGWQEWNYVATYAEPNRFSKYGNKNVYEMTAQLHIEVEEWEKPTVTYIGLENCTGIHFTLERTIFDPQTSTFNITLHAATPYVTGTLYFFYTYYRMLVEPEDGIWLAPIENDGFVHETYEEFNPTIADFNSKGTQDNYPNKAVKVTTNSFTLNGKINNYGWWDKMWNGLGDDDCDWYTFTVNPMKTKYDVTITTPNNNYTTSLFKYRCFVDSDIKESQLQLLSNTRGSKNRTFNLNPGTYFIRISCPHDLIGSDYYLVKFRPSISNNYFPLYKKTFKNYKAAIWENYYLPDSIEDRWETNFHILKSQNISTAVVSDKQGYFDPVFYDPVEDHILPMNKMILDSVIYIWGQKELEIVGGALQQLQYALRQLRSEQLRRMQICADIQTIVGGGFALVLNAVGLGELSSQAQELFRGNFSVDGVVGEFNDDAGTLCTIASAVCDLVLGSVPESMDHYNSLESALSALSAGCLGLSRAPQGVVAIPVYGEMDRTGINVNNQNIEVWAYRRTFVPGEKLYNAGISPSYIAPNCIYVFDRINEIQQFGKVINNQYEIQRTYNGKITAFDSMDTLKEHIKYEEIFDPAKILNS